MSRTVGIIGGMGPMATVDFMRRIVGLTPASRDQEHLHLLVDCDPSVPDRTAALQGSGPDPTPYLVTIARRLQRAGAEILVMPCNSAHAFADAIRVEVDTPLVDWPGVVSMSAVAAGGSCVALLATDGTLKSGVYDRPLTAAGATVMRPTTEEQDIVTAAIDGVKGNPTSNDDRLSEIRGVVRALMSRGADLLILGCTELSVLAAGTSVLAHDALPTLDASDIVARHVVRAACA